MNPTGDLQPDTVHNGYNVNGLQVASSDNFADLLSDSGYTPFGEAQRRILGDYPNQVVSDTIYDPATRRVSNTTVSQLAWNTPIDSTAYTYNASGQITATVDQQSTAAGIDSNTGIVSTTQVTDAQCFAYDYAARLRQAWTDTGGVNGTIFGSLTITSGGSGVVNPYAKPANGGIGGCVNATPTAGNIGGPAPYWETFGYDNPTGNRTSETEQDNTGTVTSTHSYSYGNNGAQPYTLTQAVTTGTDAGTNNYAYDPAGNTKTRTLAGQPAQTLNFDAQGRLASDSDGASVNVSYTYDVADGNQLIRRDTTGTTLYLGSTELHLTTNNQVTGDRYFSYAGAPNIVETGGTNPTISYEARNTQGTVATTIMATPSTDNTGLVRADQAVTARRAYTPFNTPRGTGNTAGQ